MFLPCKRRWPRAVALSLVMQRIIRIVADHPPGGPGSGVRTTRYEWRATPYGVAVKMALENSVADVAAGLRTDIRRGRFENVSQHLKTLHDGVRGAADRTRYPRRFKLGPSARGDQGQYFRGSAVGNRGRLRPRAASAASAA